MTVDLAQGEGENERSEMMKDWTGNKHSTFVTLGASNHTGAEREPNDYYATHPKAAEMLCDEIELSHRIWECACGEGHLAKVFERRGHEVKATDLIFRGYGDGGVDFLSQLEMFDGDIVTNPPYKYATEFVKHALELVPNGRKVAMFLKITFLEGKRRYEMFRKYPPPLDLCVNCATSVRHWRRLHKYVGKCRVLCVVCMGERFSGRTYCSLVQ